MAIYFNGQKINIQSGQPATLQGNDTTNTTATASDVLKGKTAYSKGVEIVGTCEYDANTQFGTATASDILSGKTACVKGSQITGTCSYNANTRDATAVQADIVSGKTAYLSNGTAVTGSLTLKTVYSGTAAPASATGVDGDIYLITAS